MGTEAKAYLFRPFDDLVEVLKNDASVKGSRVPDLYVPDQTLTQRDGSDNRSFYSNSTVSKRFTCFPSINHQVPFI